MQTTACVCALLFQAGTKVRTSAPDDEVGGDEDRPFGEALHTLSRADMRLDRCFRARLARQSRILCVKHLGDRLHGLDGGEAFPNGALSN